LSGIKQAERPIGSDLDRMSKIPNKAPIRNGNGRLGLSRVADVAAMPAGASGSGLVAQPLLYRWDYQKWSQAP